MNILKTLLTGVFAVSVCIAQNSTKSITIKDADGNIYHTVKIGNQVWTVENLKTTKYNDGTPVPFEIGFPEWQRNHTSPAYCWYKNDINNKGKYGALYNWYAVNTGKLAPKGWHVPSTDEWDTLVNYLIANGYNWDGTTTGNEISKSLAAKTDWRISTVTGAIGNDLNANNSSGFLALPGGARDGSFWNIGSLGNWWCTTEGDTSMHSSAKCAYSMRLHSDVPNFACNCIEKHSGLSVRLLQD